MNRVSISPGLIGIELEDRWEEGPWENGSQEVFGQDAHTRWFAEYSVGLYNKEAPRPLLGSRRKPIDLHAYLTVIVCSPAFKANPPGPDEAREDLAQAPHVPTENAIVQESFSEEAVTQYLEEKLERIRATTVEALKSQLAAFMVVR